MQPSPKSKGQSAEHAGRPALVDFIRETIRRDGPVTFAWFMEQALYHPEHGYYSSGRAEIGRGGDYFTNVSVGPLFGRLLTAQFVEMWEKMGTPDEFKIVEQGAHDGQFANDVFEAACAHHPAFFRALRYMIVEPFAILQERQTTTLARFERQISWQKSLDGLASFCGVHFSNELVDSMPANLVRWSGGEWKERFVAERDGDFIFVDLPLSSSELAEQLRKIPQPLPDGYETETNPAALRWLKLLSAKLAAGFIVIADYGFAREEFYAPHRAIGTLQCYAQHQVAASPLRQVGEIDLSAHVDWTSLIEEAAPRGLKICGLCDQHHFIAGLLAGGLMAEFETMGEAKSRRALQTLLHPGLMGMKFQFLVLGKNVPGAVELSSLRFARAAC